MGQNSEYVLAMYEVRGKQEFIFRSPHIKEIAGGSAIIRDIYKEYLYPQAIGYLDSKGIYNGEAAFSEAGLRNHLEKENYIGEVVYEGGGSLYLIFKKAEICRDITYRFSKEVMIATSSLKIVCTYISDLNFDDWNGDRKRLQEKHQQNEARESTIRPYASLPIVQRDYGSSHAIVDVITITIPDGRIEKKVDKEVSQESKAKYRKYYEEFQANRIDDWTMVLDKIVEERGRESHLAVIYIDGNNMGNKVKECCKELKSYEECAAKLRQFSKMIQETYIDNREENIKTYLETKYRKQKKKPGRLIIAAGDEINIICRASDAFGIAKVYLDNLQKDPSRIEFGEHSSCAGIAIFHSHAPYADAYKIAENCCESGKDHIRKIKNKNVCMLDFQYCQGAIGTDLKSIRKDETEHIISTPWLICGKMENGDSNTVTIEEVGRMWSFLKELGRSNVKGLAEKAYLGEAEFLTDLARIKAHMPEKKLNALIFKSLTSPENGKYPLGEAFEYVMGKLETPRGPSADVKEAEPLKKPVSADVEKEQLNPQLRRKLIYDMAMMYDLWFKEGEEVAEKKAD